MLNSLYTTFISKSEYAYLLHNVTFKTKTKKTHTQYGINDGDAIIIIKFKTTDRNRFFKTNLLLL